jgi:hypothetical protein
MVERTNVPKLTCRNLRRIALSPHHTRYESKHPTVEAIPVLSDEGAKVWYNRKAVSVGGDWIELKDEFCLFFFHVTKVLPLRIQLLTFKQGEESLGAAWERFIQMANSGPPHSILEEMLMEHFIGCLSPESAHFMNVASEGSVMYKKVAEVRITLEKVLDST